jgi:hypothetical protein
MPWVDKKKRKIKLLSHINCAVAYDAFTRSHFRFLTVVKMCQELTDVSLCRGIMLENKCGSSVKKEMS